MDLVPGELHLVEVEVEGGGDVWLLIMCLIQGCPSGLNAISMLLPVISLIRWAIILVSTLIRPCGCDVLLYALFKLCR